METDYDRLASRYDEDRDRFTIGSDAELRRLSAADPTRVLDLGCGTGRWLTAQTRAFPDAALEMAGVDASFDMLAQAQGKGLHSLVRARAEALPLATASFDYVFTSFAFHHFTDKDRALDEVVRVLRRGGVLRMVNIDPTTATQWWVYRFFPEALVLDTRRFWSADRIGAALGERGFQVELRIDTTSEETTIGTAACGGDI